MATFLKRSYSLSWTLQCLYRDVFAWARILGLLRSTDICNFVFDTPTSTPGSVATSNDVLRTFRGLRM